MIVDLRSDSLTQPDEGMRAAIAAAEVGDDVYGEDPTVRTLEERASALLGQEAALFVPSGTQANVIALMAQTRPGESVIVSETGHSVMFEGGGIGALAGVLPRTVPGMDGKLGAAQVMERINFIDDPHFSRTAMVVIENTTNRGGGSVYSVDEIEEIAGICTQHGLKFHCDGARFFNATVFLQVTPEAMGRQFDSVYVGLSKGLGCPAGAVLTGSKDFIHQARRYRKMLGGTMRQVGILAAAGLYALDNGYIEALAEDHRRTALFRAALEESGFQFEMPSPTNMACFQVENAMMAVGTLVQEGVRTLPFGPHHVRVMFHRGITDEGLAHAIETVRRLITPPAA